MSGIELALASGLLGMTVAFLAANQIGRRAMRLAEKSGCQVDELIVLLNEQLDRQEPTPPAETPTEGGA